MKNSARMCFIAALLLVFVWGCLLYNTPTEPPPGQAITIYDPDNHLENAVVGDQNVHFHIHNGSSRSLRILGAEKYCGSNACISPALDGVIQVPSYGEVVYACQVHISRPGPFKCPIFVHFEDGGIRTIKLQVHGVAK